MIVLLVKDIVSEIHLRMPDGAGIVVATIPTRIGVCRFWETLGIRSWVILLT